MNWIVTLSITILIVSCKGNFNFCAERAESEKETIEKMLNSEATNGLLPFANFEGVFQYRGHDSWGWFDHTIRLTRNKNNYVLQLIDQRKDPKTKLRNTIYNELLLNEEQKSSIMAMIELLHCNPVFLETGAGIDGDYYEVIIKNNSKVQGFKWQTIIDSNDSESIMILKRQIAELVGKMMSLCEFPNGSKIVIPNIMKTASDSVEYDVFLANQFNLLDYEVFFDGKPMDKNSERISRFKIHKNDTLHLSQRIIVETELLDGEIIQL